jgi:type II secretory pathway pseudopilin PulG
VIIMKSSSNKGFALITLVIAMTLIALIGAGFVSMVSKKQEGFTYLLKRQKANMAARAGIEWAIRFASDGGDVADVEKNLGEESSFETSYDPFRDRLTVDGTYQGDTDHPARITLSNFQQYLKIGDVTQLDAASFKPVESQAGQSITVGPTGVISIGKIGVQNTSGAVWYGGNSVAGNCVNGVCDFGSGFRAYFVFQYAPGSQGDGFTFAITNGTNNTANSIGGDSSMGELMAYGGDSRSYSSGYINSFVDGLGNGLRPPKFAVEFDIWPNTGCPANCGSGRCDPENEHMAYVFWGDDNRTNCQDQNKYTRWISSFSFLANTIVYGTTGYLYRSLNNITTGTIEPTWPSVQGTVTESGVQWKECSWRASINYSYGEVIAPTSSNGYFFRESRPGPWSWMTGWSEPTWTNCVDSGDECSENWPGTARWQNAAYYGFPALSVNYATNSRTYDDDKHTAGTGGNAGNSTSGTGPTNATSSDSYYASPANPAAWLADRGNSSTVNPTYAYRMEVVRNSATRTYRIKSWIAACDLTWKASTVYEKYDQVRPTNGYDYAATSDGTKKSGTTEPTWPLPPGGTVTDGEVTWVLIDTWKASTPYTTDKVVKPTVNNGYYYVAASAGTSGTTEPTWPASGTVTDGTVTWTPIPMTICNEWTNGMFGNVRSDYTAVSPTLDRTITLDTTYNTAFSKFLFGWTTASGGATQKADVWKFRLTFKP